MSVYGYIRLNSSVRTPKGLNFKQQKAKIEKWTQESKFVLKKIYRDNEPTSSSLELPKLSKLINQIEQGKITVLVVVRPDLEVVDVTFRAGLLSLVFGFLKGSWLSPVCILRTRVLQCW